MSPETLQFIEEGLAWAAKVDAVLKVVTNNPVSKLVEAAIPGAATVAADLVLVEGALDALQAAAPALTSFVAIAQAFDIKPADVNSLVWRRRDPNIYDDPEWSDGE